MIIPTVAGCAYFFDAVPNIPGAVVDFVKICSCSPLGILSFDTKALKNFGLLDDDGLSHVAFVVTGPLISVSLYSDPLFQNDRQMTIGPGSQYDLSKMPRAVPIGSGVVLGDGPPTWFHEVYSLVLNSWSLCQTQETVM